MSPICVRLFGRFEVACPGGHLPAGLEARKVQELLSYLLLAKNRPIQRERVADQLWSEVDAVRSKKYLRQALWQLRRALSMPQQAEAGGHRLLTVSQEWISIASGADRWVDIAEFEAAYHLSLVLPRNAPLGEEMRESLVRAVKLYRGDLLDGWYCDWVVPHQDVFRSMLLLMLDKLLNDAERTGHWELGLAHGRMALALDPANERVHVGMMRLHCDAGNRAAALRQFDICVQALREDLGVEPQRSTRRVRTDPRRPLPVTVRAGGPNRADPPRTLADPSVRDGRRASAERGRRLLARQAAGHQPVPDRTPGAGRQPHPGPRQTTLTFFNLGSPPTGRWSRRGPQALETVGSAPRPGGQLMHRSRPFGQQIGHPQP